MPLQRPTLPPLLSLRCRRSLRRETGMLLLAAPLPSNLARIPLQPRRLWSMQSLLLRLPSVAQRLRRRGQHSSVDRWRKILSHRYVRESVVVLRRCAYSDRRPLGYFARWKHLQAQVTASAVERATVAAESAAASANAAAAAAAIAATAATDLRSSKAESLDAAAIVAAGHVSNAAELAEQLVVERQRTAALLLAEIERLDAERTAAAEQNAILVAAAAARAEEEAARAAAALAAEKARLNAELRAVQVRVLQTETLSETAC
jgi:hypothetical protein